MIESQIDNFLQSLEGKTPLYEPCSYALKSGGKRLRPFLVFSVAEALGKGFDVSAAALSVELFHTASLIVDDLPCMDNDDERRNKPTVHKIYGEGKALLASYALITAAFEKIYENSLNRPDGEKICQIALECASRNAGIFGATGGQYLDLFYSVNSFDDVVKIIYQKTITLFEVSLMFGWIFGGGNIDSIPKIKKAAYHLGMAFQLKDDLGDFKQDQNKNFNSINYLGREKVIALFEEEMIFFEQICKELGLLNLTFSTIILKLRNFD